MKHPFFTGAMLLGMLWVAFAAIWWADAAKKKKPTFWPASLTVMAMASQMWLLVAWMIASFVRDFSFGPKGRLLMIRGRARTARARRGRGWSTAVARDIRTSPLERLLVARAWLTIAQLEHASVPAFTRLADLLMELDAPLTLAVRAYQAAREEVEHARLCFGVVEAYAGRPYTVGTLPALQRRDPGRTSLSRSERLTALAASSLRDGAFAEAVAAAVARASGERAESAAIARVLQTVADDEAKHATLGWDVVCYCVAEAGEPALAAVREAMAHLRIRHRTGGAVSLTYGFASLRRHGLLARSDIQQLRDGVLHQLEAAVGALQLPQDDTARSCVSSAARRARLPPCA